MKNLIWQDLNPMDQVKALQRPFSELGQREAVISILNTVRAGGDQALLEYTRRFDKCTLSRLKVNKEEQELAALGMDDSLKKALDEAVQNIKAFHRPQLRSTYTTTPKPGLILTREVRPLRRVGLYIPSGSAPLVSTLLMLAVPARLAGCEEIILCTPPNDDGQIHEAILGASYALGLKEIYKVGGAQAIAAMAYGTESIRKVDKIFGPGNSWVTEAKLIVSRERNGPAIDMPAGPSELMILVDDSSNPVFVASDLLSQAEHGSDSQVILVSLDPGFHSRVMWAIEQIVPKLSRRDAIEPVLRQSLSIFTPDIHQALEIAELYAPEHLSLQLKNSQELVPHIRSAGSVFCGPWTPEAAGDYASGTNHVLPTGGWARSLSGLSVESFQRTFSVQTLSQEALFKLGPTLCTLARTEGLDAHENAVRVRMDVLSRLASEWGI